MLSSGDDLPDDSPAPAVGREVVLADLVLLGLHLLRLRVGALHGAVQVRVLLLLLLVLLLVGILWDPVAVGGNCKKERKNACLI